MSRPELSEPFMLREGLRDTYEHNDEEEVTLDDADVMRIAAIAANSFPDDPEFPSHIWIADNSFGIRLVDMIDDGNETVGRTVLESDDDINGYTGYDPKHTQAVVIGSRTSGATITIERYGDKWKARFDDPEHASQRYANVFRHLGHASFWDLSVGQLRSAEYDPYDRPETSRGE